MGIIAELIKLPFKIVLFILGMILKFFWFIFLMFALVVIILILLWLL